MMNRCAQHGIPADEFFPNRLRPGKMLVDSVVCRRSNEQVTKSKIHGTESAWGTRTTFPLSVDWPLRQEASVIMCQKNSFGFKLPEKL
jgi:hypothetical protein